MDPGELTIQVTIQEQTGARDAYGQLAETWAAITGGTDVWAKLESPSGREAIQAQSNQATVTHRLTIRAELTGITPRMRALYGSRVFNLTAVRPLGTDNQFQQLDAVEVA